jgi:hypothetical protein
MSPEVIFMVDNKVVTTEKYSEIRGDVTLDPKLFDPQFWTTVHYGQALSEDIACRSYNTEVFANFSPGLALKPWGSRARFVFDATLKGLVMGLRSTAENATPGVASY